MRRLATVLLLLPILAAGCAEPRPPAGAEAPTTLPAVVELPVVTFTGEVALEGSVPASKTALLKRVGWRVDAENRTLAYLPDVVRVPPRAQLVTVSQGLLRLPDGNASRVSDVTSHVGGQMTVGWFAPPFYEGVTFGRLPNGTIEAEGRLLAPGASFEVEVDREIGNATYRGTLTFRHEGVWTVKRLDGCASLDACA